MAPSNVKFRQESLSPDQNYRKQESDQKTASMKKAEPTKRIVSVKQNASDHSISDNYLLVTRYIQRSTAADNIRLAKCLFMTPEQPPKLPPYKTLQEEISKTGIVISEQDWTKGGIHLLTGIFLSARSQFSFMTNSNKVQINEFCRQLDDHKSALRQIVPKANLLRCVTPEKMTLLGKQGLEKNSAQPIKILTYLKSLNPKAITELAQTIIFENKSHYQKQQPNITPHSLNESLVKAGVNRVIPLIGTQTKDVDDALTQALLSIKKCADAKKPSTTDYKQLNAFTEFLCQTDVNFAPARNHLRSKIRGHCASREQKDIGCIPTSLKGSFINTFAFEELKSFDLMSFLRATKKSMLEDIASEMIDECWKAQRSLKKRNKVKYFADLFGHRKKKLCIPYRMGNLESITKKLKSIQSLQNTNSEDMQELHKFCQFLDGDNSYFKPGNEYLKELSTNHTMLEGEEKPSVD